MSRSTAAETPMTSTFSLLQLFQKLDPYYIVLNQQLKIVMISPLLEIIYPTIQLNSLFTDVFQFHANFKSNPLSSIATISGQQVLFQFHYVEDFILCECKEFTIKNKKLSLEQLDRDFETVVETESMLQRRLIQTEGFIRATVHDLGAPINNLKALIRLYEIEQNHDEQAYLFELLKRSIDTLSSRQKYVSKLIKDDYLLDEEAMGPLELYNPLMLIIEEFEPFFRNSGGQIECTIPKNTVIHFSNFGLRSVFENLLSNSLKYRKQDAPPIVNINCEIGDREVTMVYTDNGSGMDIAKFNQNPFGLYRRFDEQAATGSGLGLYITKSHIQKAEGSLEIDSELGRGVRFTLKFKIPAK